MPPYHDPIELIRQLRQSLSAAKLPIGFVIGAGCSSAITVIDPETGETEPLIPNVAGLTKKILAKLSASDSAASHLEHIISSFDEDDIQSPNVELILNRIRTLRSICGKGSVRGLSEDGLNILEKEICDSIRLIVGQDLPNFKTPHQGLARFVGSRVESKTEIFTTNYDLLIEKALERGRVPFFDGFIGATLPFFDVRAIEEDALPSRWSRIWKLHGSINWRLRANDKHIIRSEAEEGEELLIHPSHMKYDESRRMPYYVMIDRLKKFIRNSNQPVVMIICGYSFNDEHINNSIIECLESNQSAACFSFLYEPLRAYRTGVALAESRRNLSLLAEDGGVIRGHQAPWMVRPANEMSILRSSFDLPICPEGEDAEIPRPCTLRLGNFEHLGDFLGEFGSMGGIEAIS